MNRRAGLQIAALSLGLIGSAASLASAQAPIGLQAPGVNLGPGVNAPGVNLPLQPYGIPFGSNALVNVGNNYNTAAWYNAANYGLNAIYGTNGSMGGGIGYGGFGGYGYGGYGYGGYGYGGYPGGVTPQGLAVRNYEQLKLASSRYNLQNAQSSEAYQAANLLRQRAIGAELNNEKQMTALREKYDPRKGMPKYSTTAAEAHPQVPMSVLYAHGNGVEWPPYSPNNQARQYLDEQLGRVLQEYNKDHQATVEHVSDARDALYNYGRPALAYVRKDHGSKGTEFRDLLNNLDASLEVMGQPPKTGPKPADKVDAKDGDKSVPAPAGNSLKVDEPKPK